MMRKDGSWTMNICLMGEDSDRLCWHQAFCDAAGQYPRAWCKTIVTTLIIIACYNSFAPRPWNCCYTLSVITDIRIKIRDVRHNQIKENSFFQECFGEVLRGLYCYFTILQYHTFSRKNVLWRLGIIDVT